MGFPPCRTPRALPKWQDVRRAAEFALGQPEGSLDAKKKAINDVCIEEFNRIQKREESRKKLEESLLRLAKEKMADKVTEIEGKKQERIDEQMAEWETGTKEDIAGADLELVQKFYAGYYHPANMHLVIAGPVNGPQTLATIESLFAAVDKERITPPEVADLSSWTFPEQVTLKEDLPPVKIAAQADRRFSGFTCYAALAPHRASNIEDVSYQILLGEKKYFVSTDGGGERQQWFALIREPAGGVDPEPTADDPHPKLTRRSP